MVEVLGRFDAVERHACMQWLQQADPVDGRGMFDVVQQLADDAVRAGATVNAHSCGVHAPWWPFVSRLLAMDDPGRAMHIKFTYQTEYDGDAGIAEMVRCYRVLLGHMPAVRSWQHARREQQWN